MKKGLILLLLVVIIAACKNDKNENITITEVAEKIELAPINDTILESAIIYEANIRQYSPEGTFNEFTKDIPELKKLGVNVIWLMPVFPISETKRKATGGDFAYLIEDEAERKKALGSYYAVSDFKKINPEYGTIEDLRELINAAHDNGIYVILDWVPNHTGWDHTWIKEHPEFYKKNDKGEITDPLNDDGTSKGWGDVAQLDYTNTQMQETMIKDMEYWLTQENIDGFRCDHVGPVPISFWEKAIPRLKSHKNVFMLAEADEVPFMKEGLFDMGYGWRAHHLMNEIAKGEKSVKDWDNLMEYLNKTYDTDDILMNFVTNHDENSWAGTVNERMGNAGEVMLALSYTMPGMPLIYSGQEYDLNHRLLFFEKDSIPKIKGDVWPILEKLGNLKAANSAFDGGKNAASYERLTTSKDGSVLAFQRSKGESQLVFIANMSDELLDFTLSVEADMINAYTGDLVKLTKDKTYTFSPWEYVILLNK